jgi:amidase
MQSGDRLTGRTEGKMKSRCHFVAQWILIVLFLTCFLNGCSILGNHSRTGSRDHVYIDYWPVASHDNRLRLAVKDNIDLKGVVTSVGSEYVAKHNPPAAMDAACLAIARQRDVRIVGKTNLSEFTVAPSGMNDYFGTPRNPLTRRRRLIPGGSSSGSAVAVAQGSADVAFGTDTAGSVRVPAACCGIVGLKTTFGLVSTKGVFPVEPKHLDTVGPMGKDVAHVVEGMDLLQNGFAARYRTAVAAKPSAKKIRIGRLYLSGTASKVDKAVDEALARSGFRVTRLDQNFKMKWDQAKKDGNTVAAAGAWISDQAYIYKSGVRVRTIAAIVLGRVLYPAQYRGALRRQARWRHALAQVFKKVDFVALPTLQDLPPMVPHIGKIALLEARMLIMQNTAAVNFAGNPALAIPIPVDDKTIPVTSLQLVGPRFGEAALLNAGHLIEDQESKH